MMKMIIPLAEITAGDRPLAGGKAWALSRLLQEGINVPEGICITSEVYRLFIHQTGLEDIVQLELNRKSFEEMRWEEIWDVSLRIRNHFLRMKMPPEIASLLEKNILYYFGTSPTVVRSSAPSEDSAATSFAGLHESVVNVRGRRDIIAAVRRVWASLWSDGAILYRRELGLDVHKSTMAVVIQEIIKGERSGVAFTEAPDNSHNSILEAVWGLNQGFVDGTVEPDRWFFLRETGKTISHTPPSQRDRIVIPSTDGTMIMTLDDERSKTPPLSDQEAEKLLKLGMRVEDIFLAPQDMEWTIRGNRTYLLQSRPVTTIGKAGEDRRSWYLSLTRSLDNLKGLRERIETTLLPAMDEDALKFKKMDLIPLTDNELSREITDRLSVLEKWEKVYWDDFIPFAHGARLFGQFYNDRMTPKDPYEFVDLLVGTEMTSIARNTVLEDLAEEIRRDGPLREKLGKGLDIPAPFLAKVQGFVTAYETIPGSSEPDLISGRIIQLILEMADSPPSSHEEKGKKTSNMKDRYLASFQGKERLLAQDLLELGRASWKLRDNDNIYLARIKVEVERASSEGKRRIQKMNRKDPDLYREAGDVARALDDPDYMPPSPDPGQDTVPEITSAVEIRVRQVKGQPASPGIATGTARVIRHDGDLFEFKKGEILVCDAIEPNMTFVVPLASAIVERRGGMLIHGAIIAREYGLPCVTGIPGAVDIISTGKRLTVDGHLGIVIIGN